LNLQRRLLVDHLSDPNARIVFVTGAGVSVASGIPSFRGNDPDAVWANDVMEMGTYAFFEKDPVEQWRWYLSRFSKCQTASPNPAHTALAEIEQWVWPTGRSFTLITQNVDGLHVQAGSMNVVEVHGAARRLRCSQRLCINGAPYGSLPWDNSLFDKFLADPCKENLPRCPACDALLRAHVLWFDEYYGDHEDYGLETATSALESATCVVFAGTSFAVGITFTAVQLAGWVGAALFNVDPHNATPIDGMTTLREPAEELFPWLAAQLATATP
jgi:NAD-dependent deacetylase